MPCIPAMINQHQVCLEFAKALPAQIQGLSNRKTIPDNYGLVFDTQALGKGKSVFFTMSNMKFPIDMIFVKDNKIQLIEYNTKPCNTTPDKCPVYGGFPVDMVLETKAGNATKWGIQMFQKFNITNNTSDTKK
jgi:uncharacterized membrane protein (UPF0127 family)